MDRAHEFMRDTYHFCRNIIHTIGDGFDFCARTITNLKRLRPDRLPPPNPLADPQSQPLLLTQASAPPTTTDEDRPSKRRRLSSIQTAPRTFSAPPTLPTPPTPPVPATPSAFATTPFAMRRSSSGLPDALQAPTPPALAFTSRSRQRSTVSARPPAYPSSKRLNLPGLTRTIGQSGRSAGLLGTSLRPPFHPNAIPKQSRPSSSILRPSPRRPGPLLREPKSNEETKRIKRLQFLPPRPTLVKKRQSASPVIRQLRSHQLAFANQPKGRQLVPTFQRFDAPTFKAQPSTVSKSGRDAKAESSDESTDPEKVLGENHLRQKVSVTKEKESERQSLHISHKIREQDRLVKEHRFRRQAAQRTVIARVGQHWQSEIVDKAEQPPSHAPQFLVNYYEDVERNAYYWDEECDIDAKSERRDKLTVIDDWSYLHNRKDHPFSSAFAPLTPIALRRLRHTFVNRRYFRQELNRIDGVIITGEDILKLKPSCWLNDEVINGYFELIVERNKLVVQELNRNVNPDESRNGEVVSADAHLNGNGGPHSPPQKQIPNGVPRVTYINSFFYSRMVGMDDPRNDSPIYDYHRIRRWTRKLDVFAHDLMLIPINQQNLHWTLGVVNFVEKTVSHLDSMGRGGSDEIGEHLLRWVRDEAHDKGVKNFREKDWKIVKVKVPEQSNSDDCGVFTCKFGDWLSRGWNSFTFTQQHMNYFRGRMAHELLMGRAF